jgi:hypothetical protein
MAIVLDGTTGITAPSVIGTPVRGGLVSGTAVASTSGTSIDFTGIPSWVKRITVMFSGVSLSGTSSYLVQLGDSGGVENTGYLSAGVLLRDATAVAAVNYTTGFGIGSVSAAYLMNGSMSISLIDSATNNWSSAGNFSTSSTGAMSIVAGTKALSATLDRVRITTLNGTDTFDAGSINIMYEG